MFSSPEVIFSQGQALYSTGTHNFTPTVLGAGYQSVAMRATKVKWPKTIANLFVGHLDLSDDAGQTWRRIATWREDGNDVHDKETGAPLDYSFLQLSFSARQDKPVYSHENSWVRGAFECAMPITTAITIERLKW
jgi:hypothetical protein